MRKLVDRPAPGLGCRAVAGSNRQIAASGSMRGRQTGASFILIRMPNENFACSSISAKIKLLRPDSTERNIIFRPTPNASVPSTLIFQFE